ncbi:hypothetical protein ACFELO_14325 [Oceanicaulis sp. LC35]|uniref:hypothetical protein n=1 Tax=Oceanicaulis sp. LC35 TaxID=3349635 RepID=UPI003F85A4B0
MSYIDSYDHVLVGYMAGLPLYRPLEDIPGPENGFFREDFPCRKDQLVLGGGSGEHEGLVLARPGAAMALYALDSEDFEFPEAERARLNALIAEAPVLVRYGWDGSTHRQFKARCKSAALPNPYDRHYGPFDAWLAMGFGEFCYAAMPDLDPDMAKALRACQIQPPVHVRYSNVLLPPPGLPVYARSGTAFEARLRIFGSERAEHDVEGA